MSQAAPAHCSGWRAEIDLGLARRGGRTALVHRRQRGPLSVQRPFYPENDLCHLYLLHPPGGVVGGDQLSVRVVAETGANGLVTTPGASKFYRSHDAIASQRQELLVADDASLEWLPQENIFFPGALVDLQTCIRLSQRARFIGWESQCLGRPAIQENFASGQLDLQLRIERTGRPLLLERLRVSPHRLRGASGLRGHAVTGSLLATPASSLELKQARLLLDKDTLAGVTLLDDVLVVRYLGDSTEQCRALFVRVWRALRGVVIGRPACAPRIWST